ncbi:MULTISPECIES: DUF397 domain-containing protein [Thermomonospora]|uniref:DUF397 domain-containing protein n=1 Tax=Thermomonospora curvata (strain ATCC 19995 / DSM 43183 / JCM 3096 / KCTC 9072 / NBRC 15933 / NCIMB 10081 / Henssen B9) TaxID=471852 RepID=D1ABL8_THECD|nr:protein of unknown function DUF397 [Thermomonospora curvata DSM 43183]PKK13400.1 MAG: DUF397 domain-containing protein [Thermomonospora sp. CIF 1]
MKWRKSSYSGANGGACVELARVPGTRQVAVRDSKQPDGPQHRLSLTAMTGLITAIKNGDHDLRRS